MDHRPERRDDALALGAETLHRHDGRVGDARQRAAPARMGGADDARLRVREQHRTAVGRGNADCQPGHARHDRVGARARFMRPRLLRHHHVGRVDLVGAQERLRGDAERGRHAGAVLGHVLARIGRSDTAVEARIDAQRGAALAGEEGMA